MCPATRCAIYYDPMRPTFPTSEIVAEAINRFYSTAGRRNGGLLHGDDLARSRP